MRRGVGLCSAAGGFGGGGEGEWGWFSKHLFKGSGSKRGIMLARVLMYLSGRMGITSVQDGSGGDGRGWGKRDDFVDGVESVPIYTCDRAK